jgi:hypothetical protein
MGIAQRKYPRRPSPSAGLYALSRRSSLTLLSPEKDLHIWKGEFPSPSRLPLVGGHEDAGYIAGPSPRPRRAAYMRSL